MSFEHGAHHFTWFLDVLRAFVSVSELIWGYFIINFIIKKGVKLRNQTHKILDFLTMTERIDIKIGGYIERKLCVCFGSFKPHSCWQREVIFPQISHFMVENDHEIGLKLKYLLSFGSKWSCECLHM